MDDLTKLLLYFTVYIYFKYDNNPLFSFFYYNKM